MRMCVTRGVCGSLLAAGMLLVAPAELLGQSSRVTIVSPRPTGGTIAGFVQDSDGQPVSGVRVLIEEIARQTQTATNGAFVLEGIPAGPHRIRFRKLGYAEAQTELSVIVDSAITVGVTLVPIAERLDAVVIEATILNQVTGLVTDASGTPLGGVVIEVLGLNMRLETNEAGRYVLLDLKPGNYLLQFRAPGYRVSQYGLRMVAQIERDITTKLQYARTGDRMTAQVAAAVAIEANSRHSLRGGQSMILGRDELERFDTAPLAVALASSRAALLLEQVNQSCILVNGHEPVTTSTAAEQFAAQTNTSTAPGFFRNAPSRSAAVGTRQPGGWLSFFRANEVEMIELYTEGSENSRTVCGRFQASSGCSCPPEPSALVIWLRR